MSLFKDIINEINSIYTNGGMPTEDMVKHAVNGMKRMQILYDDHDPNYVYDYGHNLVGPEKGKNTRYILPVAFGENKKGNKLIRAYQTTGSSRRGEAHWKLFRFDRIRRCSVGTKSFAKYTDQLKALGLNDHGDSAMTKFFAITPIAQGSVKIEGDTNDIKPTPVAKDNNSFASEPQNANNAVNTIDNNQNNTYSPNTETAPSTKPVVKTDLLPTVSRRYNVRGANGRFTKQNANVNTNNNAEVNTNDIESTKVPQATEHPIDDKPVSKQEVDNTETAETKPTVSNVIPNPSKDMMDRMNNVYNNEEEKEE